MKRTTFILSLILLAVSVNASDHILMNSGHIKSVDAFAVDPDKSILFSGDENGTVKVWDIKDGHLIRDLQVSHLPIKKIAVNPVNSDIAVLETDNLTTFKLSVWDWKKGKKLFTHRLPELPLSMMFSPKGSFILYSKPDWDSLSFLDAGKGYRKNLSIKGTGIVSAAYVSASEKTLLLYTPSGTIQYWDLKNGRQKISPIRTKGNLSSVLMAPNGTYMTGIYDGKMYLIDLVSGRIMDTITADNISGASMDRKTGRIILISTENKKSRINIYRVYNSTLRFVKSLDTHLEVDNSASIFMNNSVYFSTSGGTIYKSDVISGETSVFSRNIYQHVADLGITNGSMLVSAGDSLVKISSDLFEDIKKPVKFSSFSVQPLNIPEEGPEGITTDGNGSFYIYPKGKESPSLKILSAAGAERVLTRDFTSAIASIRYFNGKLLSLEENGRCSIIDSITGQTDFVYKSYGIQTVTRDYLDNIIAGRNQTGLIKSPLLNINTKTEEVVPIRDSNILTFMVDYDQVTRTLYSLGFEKNGSSLKTVLKRHRGKNLEITSTLLTYPGEDANAWIIVDSKRSRVFTTLGYGGIHMLSWNGFTTLEESQHIPRKLYLYRSLLVSINSDSSISVWNTGNGRFLMDIYILDNGGWAAIRRDGKIFASSSARQYIISVKY